MEVLENVPGDIELSDIVDQVTEIYAMK